MSYGKAFTLCAAAAMLAVATPAPAKSPPVYVVAPSDLITRHISYADLNLASAAGEQTLRHRVSSGVTELCDEASGGRDGSTAYRYNMIRCSSAAWDQARPQMALAVQRAREIAATGSSSIVAAALTISLPQ